MSCTDVVTLIAAILAFAGSILSVYLGTPLAIKKERRQLIWTMELERLFRLEEFAGSLVELLGSYGPGSKDDADIAAKLRTLKDMAGRFGRYPQVRQAVRDLHNTSERMLRVREQCEDEREVRKELQDAYRALLNACDSVVQRDNPKKERITRRST